MPRHGTGEVTAPRTLEHGLHWIPELKQWQAEPTQEVAKSKLRAWDWDGKLIGNGVHNLARSCTVRATKVLTLLIMRPLASRVKVLICAYNPIIRASNMKLHPRAPTATRTKSNE